MIRALLLVLLPVMTGCAGMVIETRGFRPETAATIHRVLGAKSAACTQGVAAEKREIEIRNVRVYDPMTERSVLGRPSMEARSDTRHIIDCR
jgi:hypothetical protein